jgi:hypothetical protein
MLRGATVDDGGAMFLRLLFVLLVTLNIVAGAWLWLGQPYTHVPPAADPGVRELRLLSEMPTSATTVAVPASPTPTAAAQPEPAGKPAPELRCLTLGPFATPHDLQQARSALAPLASRMRSRQELATQSSSWWVYLPAQGSRAQALAVTQQLAAHGIQDYFVVGGGDQSNTISLGLFHDQDNARHRRDQVIAAGYPARINERTETVPQYWLDLVASGRGIDWRSRIRGSGVGSHSTSCF